MPSIMCLNYVYLFTTCPIYLTYPVHIYPGFVFYPVVLVNKVPRSFQNVYHSSSQLSVANCRGRKFCLSNVSSKFFTLRHQQPSCARDYWPSDLCINAFQICARINALKILHVNVFRGFSKNTKYSDIPSHSSATSILFQS